MSEFIEQVILCIKRNLKFAIVLSIFIVLITIIFIFNRNYFFELGFQDKVEVITNIFAIIAAIWAVYEFVRKNNRAKAEKAIELANEFEKEILPLINKLSLVIDFNKFDKVFKKMNTCDVFFFNTDELNTFFDKEEIKEYQKMCKTISIIGTEVIVKDSILDIEIKENIKISPAEVLNKLEAFAMAFNHAVADETVVYQSLHQVFFSTVKTLYIHIASLNNTDRDRYFSNVIKLFNDWNKRYNKIKLKNQKIKEKEYNKFKRV